MIYLICGIAAWLVLFFFAMRMVLIDEPETVIPFGGILIGLGLAPIFWIVAMYMTDNQARRRAHFIPVFNLNTGAEGSYHKIVKQIFFVRER